MPDLPTDWSALCALVFLLGLRHGFDADHLAAIDGLTRLAGQHHRAHARCCGAVFSLGHGSVVMAVAAAVGVLSMRWVPPGWLAAGGTALSIAFLLLIGIVNLRAVLKTPPGTVVPLVGIKGPLLARLLPAQSPLGVAVVGALFALSFDTLSLAALFGVTAAPLGGLQPALALGGLFALGMVLADGLNGWWIARLIARADATAALASRVMGLAVAGVSLLVAAVGVGRLLSPALDGWSEGRDLAFGSVVVLVIAGSYLVARGLAHSPAVQRVPA